MPPSDVTVVIATRNRWSDLERTIPQHEAPVILVDNGSSDGTPARVRQRFPGVHVVALPRNCGALARNIGVRLATTPYVAFADDDSWWAPGALERASQMLANHPGLAVLAGSILVGEDESLDPVCDEMAHSPLPTRAGLPGPSVLGFLACGAVVRRDAFLAAGGFDEVIFFGGEEERLALDLASLGWELCYVPEVVAHHHPSPVRDPEARRRQQTRNQVLTTVLRRPWPVIAATTLAALRGGPAQRAGALAALRRAPLALLRRRVIPRHIEWRRNLLDLS